MNLNIEKLSKKVFQFIWDDPMHETNVQVMIPDLSNLECSTWGDWGPMHTFTLRADDGIKVAYNGKNTHLEQKQLKVESPILSDERRIFPYVVKISDPQKDICFYLYLDREMGLGKVQVFKTSNVVKVFDTVVECA